MGGIPSPAIGPTVGYVGCPCLARRGLKTNPRDYLTPDGSWPEGPLTDDAPDEARFAMGVGQRMKAHCEANGLSMNAVSRATNVPVQTVINLLTAEHGETCPHLRLEAGLQTRLWVRRDLPG